MANVMAPIKAILNGLQSSGEALSLLGRTFFSFHYLWFKRAETLRQMYIAGVKSLFVVSIVATFSGMIISLQTGLALRDFGQQDLIGQVIVVTLTREVL